MSHLHNVNLLHRKILQSIPIFYYSFYQPFIHSLLYIPHVEPPYRGGVEVRTSDPQSREPGSSPFAAVSKLGQFRSPHIASVHSAV